jgi:5'-3' exonuclease
VFALCLDPYAMREELASGHHQLFLTTHLQALRAENVEYVVAPYEADAQLCFLEREGYVDGIITEDSDLLVFGCKQVSRIRHADALALSCD